FVGSGVAELVHSATVAVVGKVPLESLWHAVPSYPTVSEVWLRLLEPGAIDRPGPGRGCIEPGTTHAHPGMGTGIVRSCIRTRRTKLRLSGSNHLRQLGRKP
ncbi:hypothetical protein GS461_11845, partial [Rhodococcus hoagii]|nr:hypothetical protein [Prescottella equi]